MAKSKVYKLYSSSTGSAAAQLNITQDGFITAISWDVGGQAAAAATGAVRWGLALNASTSQFTTNDTPANDLDAITVAGPVASAAVGATKSVSGLSVPVFQTDRLYLHQATAPGGTAFSSGYGACWVTVTTGK